MECEQAWHHEKRNWDLKFNERREYRPHVSHWNRHKANPERKDYSLSEYKIFLQTRRLLLTTYESDA